MFGSGIVDLVIGMLFVFLVFSLLVSGVNETIMRIVAWRSRHLWRALRQLLDGEGNDLTTDQRPKAATPAADAAPWTDRLYVHPLITGLEGRLPTAGGQMDRFTQDLGAWFDAGMEAVSARYKRHVKWFLVALGLIVAVSFNVDAIAAAQRLYRDDALRSAVAQQATVLVATCNG